MTPRAAFSGAAGFGLRVFSQATLGAALTLAGCAVEVDIAARLPAATTFDGGAAVNSDATKAAACAQGQCPPQGGAIVSCATTINGTVVAPTRPEFGTPDPLYNALVYIPTGPVAPFSAGVACERCGPVSGAPRASALTGPDGTFTLRDVPAGTNIPLVVQIGRWRRQVVIPEVTACTDTYLPTELTRLPRNRAEGDIPAIAIATGQWDPFDCTLRKIGIDDDEFTLPGGTGRINMWSYRGHHLGLATPYGDQLVGSLSTMSKYDIVIAGQDDDDGPDKDPALQKNLLEFANRGGRIFLTDTSHSWLRDGIRGEFQQTVIWKSLARVQGFDFIGRVDQGFPKGVSFSQWLSVVGATGAVLGRLPIHDPFRGISVVDNVVPPTQRWIYTDGTTAGAIPSVQHFTFNAPISAPADQQCGRVVFSQFHVAGDSIESEGRFNNLAGRPRLGGVGAPTFPALCNGKIMTPQEKALEFMLFDASSCIQPDWMSPAIP